MRELNANEIKAVSGARRWSIGGAGGSNQGNHRGTFEFNNFGKPGINVGGFVEVGYGGGKFHWGDRGVMVGFTNRW